MTAGATHRYAASWIPQTVPTTLLHTQQIEKRIPILHKSSFSPSPPLRPWDYALSNSFVSLPVRRMPSFGAYKVNVDSNSFSDISPRNLTVSIHPLL
jgi:hypothetical protein